MLQSTSLAGPARRRDGIHVAVVMDGNGRWAQKRGLPRSFGHRAGALAVRRTVTVAAGTPRIQTLTLYAFSSDNWRRPPAEVRQLMSLLRTHLASESARCAEEGVRVSIIGRRDRLDTDLVASIEAIEARTRAGRQLHLHLAIDYSARDSILEAARLCRHPALSAPPSQPSMAGVDSEVPPLSREDFSGMISTALHAQVPLPAVDLLVRTGGEQRLSDFLLWECAYAELVFTPRLWPDFEGADLELALREFDRRERRFGGLIRSHGLRNREVHSNG